MTKTAAAPAKGPAVKIDAPDEVAAKIAAPDKPLSDWTPAEICAIYDKEPPKPLSEYTMTELVTLKNFGPSAIGGALYLAAQSCSNQTVDGRYGPAILSKGSEPVPSVSEQ